MSALSLMGNVLIASSRGHFRPGCKNLGQHDGRCSENAISGFSRMKNLITLYLVL